MFSEQLLYISIFSLYFQNINPKMCQGIQDLPACLMCPFFLYLFLDCICIFVDFFSGSIGCLYGVVGVWRRSTVTPGFRYSKPFPFCLSDFRRIYILGQVTKFACDYLMGHTNFKGTCNKMLVYWFHECGQIYGSTWRSAPLPTLLTGQQADNMELCSAAQHSPRDHSISRQFGQHMLVPMSWREIKHCRRQRLQLRPLEWNARIGQQLPCCRSISCRRQAAVFVCVCVLCVC